MISTFSFPVTLNFDLYSSNMYYVGNTSQLEVNQGDQGPRD